ncbi:hypothetical protein ILYODFUR_001730 [Ilyodon furcidens]|uniref:Uncharacterized protein n=1 Tax=Ilyodon furcidens TaxID=33524 RepID=A0ABV0SIX0_9TELE
MFVVLLTNHNENKKNPTDDKRFVIKKKKVILGTSASGPFAEETNLYLYSRQTPLHFGGTIRAAGSSHGQESTEVVKASDPNPSWILPFGGCIFFPGGECCPAEKCLGV